MIKMMIKMIIKMMIKMMIKMIKLWIYKIIWVNYNNKIIRFNKYRIINKIRIRINKYLFKHNKHKKTFKLMNWIRVIKW